MIVFEQRASTIIYNLLKTIDPKGIFLLPANVCPVLPITFMKADKRFELVDISEHDYCIDQEQVFQKMRLKPDKYAGIIYVRTYGYLKDEESFFSSVKEISTDLLIIDDRCLCTPEQQTNSSADLVLYSTGASKPIDIGFGGYAIIKENFPYNTFSQPFSEKDELKIIEQYKKVLISRDEFIYHDINWLNTTQPSMDFNKYWTLVKKKWISIKKLKSIINKIYREGLPQEIQLKPSYQNWRFNILVNEKEALLETIFSKNLFASSHYISLDGIFSRGNSPISEALQSRVINLFNDNNCDEERALKIVDIINCHVKG